MRQAQARERVHDDDTAVLEERHRLALRRLHEDGARACPGVALPFSSFAAAVLLRALRRLDHAGLAPDRRGVAAALTRVAGADLYLAVACERGATEAWDFLHRTLAPRLLALAMSRGASHGDADEIVQDLLGDLVQPAEGKSAIRISGYDGTGSLFGWLSVIVLRRLAHRRSRNAPRSLDAAADDDRDPLIDRVADDSAAAPDAMPAVRESEARFVEAMAAGLFRLTVKERLALCLKYRDGMHQRRIAQLLRIGEPRVSRLVQAAISKVGDVVRRALPDGVDGLDPAVLTAALAQKNRLGTATSARGPAPPGKEPTP